MPGRIASAPVIDSNRPASREPRPVCPRCERPQSACLCRWVRPTSNRIELLILQHPLEVRQAKGSARLLRLSLAHCRCQVGEAFDERLLVEWLDAPLEASYAAPGTATAPVHNLLLYPADADTAVPPSPLPLPANAAWRLVLLDGTWRKTRKLLHANPLLRTLPRWPLPAPPPPRYTIRRAQREGQRSTLEAACLALGLLEDDPGRYAPLLTAFDGWVAEQASWASGGPRQTGSPG